MMMNLSAAIVAVALVSAAPKAPKQPSPTAERIVNDVAHVKEDEVVLITGGAEDAVLLQDLYLAAAKQGALPIIRISDAKLERRWYDLVQERFDKNLGAIEDKLVTLPDVYIGIDRRDAGMFKDVPVARRMAVASSMSGLAGKAQKRGTRIVYVGNGMWPTAETAKAVGVKLPELKKLFEAGLNADVRELGAAGEALRMEVPSGKELRITTKAGTDLKLKLTAKPMTVSDGNISGDDIRNGGPALTTWLPAGEVYGLVAPGTAEGTIVVPRFPFEGQDIKDLKVTVAAGKVTALTAKPSKAFDAFKAQYDAAPAGKESVGVFDIGLNQALKVKGKALQSFLPAGTVTIIIGGDEWAGGTNTVAYGFACFLPDATLLAEGKTMIIDNGSLQMAPRPPPP